MPAEAKVENQKFLTLVHCDLIAEEQVSEAVHKDILNGVIRLPAEEQAVIDNYRQDLNSMLKLMFNIYLNFLCKGDITSAGNLIKYFPCFAEPDIPAVLDALGITAPDDDPFLDKVGADKKGCTEEPGRTEEQSRTEEQE